MNADNKIGRERPVALPDPQPDNLLKRRAAVLAALLAVLIFADQQSASLLPRLCPWYNLTGIDCPFCGLTRSVIATADLHPTLAFQLHPFGPLVLALLGAWLILCCLGFARGRGGRTLKIPRRLKIAAGVALAGGWLCWWLYTTLAPIIHPDIAQF